MIPSTLIEKFLTDENISRAGDEILPAAEHGHRVALIKKEKDGKYYVHKCIMEYKNGSWEIAKIEETFNFTELVKQILKWKNK